MDDNEILRFLIENSLFSPKQFEIIFKRLKGERRTAQSRGAYYRVLGQGREKLEGIFYSLLLLEATGLMEERRQVLGRLSQQVAVMRSGDIGPDTARDVIRIVQEVVKRLSQV